MTQVKMFIHFRLTNMFRASLCPSSGDRLYITASGVSLDVLAAVVWSQDTSWAHYVNAGIRLSRIPAFTQCSQLVSCLHTTAASTSRLTPDAVLHSLSPDDGHNDARNMLSLSKVNKHLYLCHPLCLSSPTLMMHGHMNLKYGNNRLSRNVGKELPLLAAL